MNKNYVALDYNNWRYDSRCFTGHFKESSTRMVESLYVRITQL